MKKKIFLYSFAMLLILFSCSKLKQCDPTQVVEEVNNGNSDPKTLILELNHSAVITAFELAFGKPGCTGVGNGAATKGKFLNCDVEVTVKTASLVGTNIIPDKDAYFNKKFKSQSFEATALGTKNTTYNISVPEKGAFAIEYVISSNDCNQCCSGGVKQQCGAFGTNGLCKEGKPKINLTSIFMSEGRPKPEQNLIPGSLGEQWGRLFCEDCDTCPEKKCY